jgi:CO/xanthine dehydrogenase FAD-binding subunit
VRFGFGAVGPRPIHVVDGSGVLADPRGDPAAQRAALLAITAHATPISNVRASREYREAMLAVLSARALATARARLAEARRAAH